MNHSVEKVLIVGGGFSGMCAAIQLRKLGISVDLVELDPDWSPLGAGITLASPTLRAFEEIGIVDELSEQGFCFENVDILDAIGNPIAQIPTPKPVGSNQEGAGIMRPVLASILSKATRQSGVNVKLGRSYKKIVQDENGVDVTFTDGSAGRYDLVVGADGLHSKVRESLFPEGVEPHYTKQACWRAVLTRPSEIVRTTFWMGPLGKVGVTPISDTRMYMFMNEYRATLDRPPIDQWPSLMADLVRPFPATILQNTLPELSGSTSVDFRSLHNLLLPRPWHKGRVVLLGDSVHATTPHLASGAGIGIESAIVLSEELAKPQDLNCVLTTYEERRWGRSRLVVENSAQLVAIENGEGNKEDQPKIMGASMQALAQPI